MVGYLKEQLKKLSIIWTWLGLNLCFGLIFWLRWRIIERQPLWLDEVFTYKFSLLSWHDLFAQVGYYVDYAHPPGFYLLTKLWLTFSASELWLRLPALVLALGSAWLLYHIMELLKADFGKWLVLLYFAGHWLLVQIGSELRMYQAVFFLMLLVVLIIFTWWKQKIQPNFKQLVMLVGLLTLAIYLDYAALWLMVVLCVVWLTAWWRKTETAAWLSLVLSGVFILTAPQLWILVTHFDLVQQLNLHLQFSDWLALLLSLHSLTGLPFGLIFGALGVGLTGVFLFYQYREDRVEKSEAFLIPVFLLLAIVVPISVVLLTTNFGFTLVQPRNLLLVVIGFMLSLSWGVDAAVQKLQLTRNKVAAAIAATVVLGWNCLTPKAPLSNNWFWIRNTVVQGYTLVFVGEHEYLLEPFLIYYSQQPTPLTFEYFVFSSLDELNQQPPQAEKILVVYEESESRGSKVLTKNDIPLCAKAQCEVMGVR